MKESNWAAEILGSIVKDFKIEFRNRYALNISISFAIISTLAISLSLGGVPVSIKMQSALLWIILFFCAMSGLSHIFIREEEQETALFLRINAKPEAVLTSKLLFNIFLFLLLELVIIPIYIFFLQLEINFITHFILTIIIGGFAISSSTTILAAIVAKAGGKGALFTVVSFPVVIPILWIAINSTAQTLGNTVLSDYRNIIFLLAFSGAIIALSYIMFDHIWIEE